MKSIDVETTSTTDHNLLSRWVGMTIGTNNLTHLEQNLQVLTLGKTEDVRKLFNIPRLRAAANPNFDPMHYWHVRERDRFERKIEEIKEKMKKEENNWT